MFRRGFSTLVTGAVILFLIIIITSYFLFYVNSGLNTITNLTEDSKRELIREREYLRVYQNSSLIKMINEGSQVVKVRGLFVEYGNETTVYIDLPIELRAGEYYIYDASKLGSYKHIYVLTDTGKIYSPIPESIDLNIFNEIFLQGNETFLISDKQDVDILYFPNSSLYISTSNRNYQVDLGRYKIIYVGKAKIFASKDGTIIMTKYAIYMNRSIIYKLIDKDAKPVYIGIDYMVFKVENPLHPYYLDSTKLYIVSNEVFQYIGTSLTAGVSGDYLYYLENKPIRYKGKLLYTLNIIGEKYSTLRKVYLLLDFPIQQIEMFLNERGKPMRIIGRFSPFERERYYKEYNVETFTYNLTISEYLNDKPVYTKDENNILTSMSSNINTNFKIVGGLYGSDYKAIWGIVNHTAREKIETTNSTLIQYNKSFPINGIYHCSIYDSFAFEKIGDNIIFPSIISYHEVNYLFEPYSVSLNLDFSAKLSKHYVNNLLKVSMSSSLSIYLNLSGSIENVLTTKISTGDIKYQKLGSCHQAYYIDVLIGFHDKGIIIYLSVYKSYGITDLQSDEIIKDQTYTGYNPQLIFNKTYSLNFVNPNVILAIANYTKIEPGDYKDKYSTFISIPILSISSKSLLTYPESYLEYARKVLRLPNMYMLLKPCTVLYYPPTASISYSNWDYAYVYPPIYFSRCGWRYIILYKYTSSNQFYGSRIFYLNKFTVEYLSDNINRVGIWIMDFSISGEYNFTCHEIKYAREFLDYNVIASPKKLLILIPTGYGYVLSSEKY